MDYPFENLNDEKFQQLCQALLVKDYPQAQCFPVGQPDGGRDAISFYTSARGSEFIVFQVKFVRNLKSDEDPRKWLMKTVQGELQKIKTLVPRGAYRYIMLTNVAGTAHLDSGSIDQMNQLLTQEISIPSQCLWRDDLSRRLDGAWDLKWVYPELMTGPDLIRSIVEGGLLEHRDRRATAIRMFVRDQYQIDQQVRFKQVELQNRLLDLFIDLPIEHQPQGAHKVNHVFQAIAHTIVYRLKNSVETGPEGEIFPEMVMHEPFLGKEEQRALGAATLLLHPLTQQFLPLLVLEGAPGQGKSTIAQYVCQVHRMRLLNEFDLSSVPQIHKLNPVKIPFKIDLRDLATWLAKKNPFTPEETSTPPEHWYKSIEAFLAALVRHHSGGADFTHDDLIAVFKISAILLVFDGLDEIADIGRRQEVVEEITKGVNRLKDNCASLQVIVTSRPAAFANSPGLPDDLYPYFQLGSVTRPLIDDYANKWLLARRVDARQSAEFRKVLREKLDQPHLRDLARNPMQLAILLSLILTRGTSLPDKRTALYDAYIELFFNREAEKSPVVRDNRDLLIDLHRYLAWVIHAEAEQEHGRGSVSADRLHSLVESYLEKEGYDVRLARRLFTGMVERVVALVSRVEGTYEFEVQPLREYFAARFLYDTAPYSPPGQERHGTLPDRFDAIARDFYWLNVARFYAGCYNKGELASLVECLQELAKSNGYRYTNHPRVLAATLLMDWVFAQSPKSVRDVVRLVVDELGLRYVLTYSSGRGGRSAPMVLPKNCGNDELLNRCFEVLRSDPPEDYATDILELARANGNAEELKGLWLKGISAEVGDPRTRWLDYGLNLQVLSKLTIAELEDVFADAPDSTARLLVAFRGRRLDFIEASESRCTAIVKGILDGQALISSQRGESFLDLFYHSLDPRRYVTSFESRRSTPLFNLWESGPERFININADKLSNVPSYTQAENCMEIIRTAEMESKRTASEWASDLAPWSNIVEKTRQVWGDCWACYKLANFASGIKSPQQTSREFPEILDHSKPLCPRTRYARLRAGTGSWWRKQLQFASKELDQMFVSLVFLTWASADTTIALLDAIQPVLDGLSEDDWSRVVRTAQISQKSVLQFDLSLLPEKLGARSATALGVRAGAREGRGIYQKYLADYSGKDPEVLRFCTGQAVNLGTPGTNWTPELGIVETAYKEGIIPAYIPYHLRAGHLQVNRLLPLHLAETIAGHPDRFPSSLVALAEAGCRASVGRKVIPVGKIAERDVWFAS